MIEIKEITSRNEMKKFANFPLKLYKGNNNYIPCFYCDEVGLFGDNIFSDYTDSKFFLAYRDGKIVGRIGVIINHAYNRKMNVANARFTRFDAIDDKEVSRALFAAAEKYAREVGMNTVHGPLGYEDIDKEGMLIKGYEYPATYGGVYNFPYYNEHMEALGYSKEIDWCERRIPIPQTVDERLSKVADLVKKRYKLHDAVSNDCNVSHVVDVYGKRLFALLNEAYKNMHGVVPFTERVMNDTIKSFKLILNARYLSVIVDEDDNIIGMGVALPKIWEALNKCQGKLFPTGIFRLIHATKHFDEIELALIGIQPEWRNKAINAIIMERIWSNCIADGIKFAETNATLENNFAINNLWEPFPHEKHKARRCYIKKLDD